MRLANICHLGVKELRSLVRDPIMLVLIVYAFTLSVYTAATAMPETLNKAPIAVVNEDRSPLSWRIVSALKKTEKKKWKKKKGRKEKRKRRKSRGTKEKRRSKKKDRS